MSKRPPVDECEHCGSQDARVWVCVSCWNKLGTRYQQMLGDYVPLRAALVIIRDTLTECQHVDDRSDRALEVAERALSERR